jgi:DNA repair exonuclease SbcCD ATPase subunit
MDKLREEGRKLQTKLGEIAAQNCSFRKKDFDILMEDVLSRIEKERKDLFEERRRIGEALKEYFDYQGKLVLSLKDEVAKYIEGHVSKAEVESFVDDIKASYEERGEEIYNSLRAFQYRLQVYKKETKRLNEKLRRLIERGNLLKAEVAPGKGEADASALQAGAARQEEGLGITFLTRALLINAKLKKLFIEGRKEDGNGTRDEKFGRGSDPFS